MSHDDMITIHADILQLTNSAVLAKCEGEDVWLPLSQIDFCGERGDTSVPITLPAWLAEEKGLSDGDGKSQQPAQGGAEAASEPQEADAPASEADRTVDIMLTILEISEDGETATVQVAEGGEPCEISTADFTHDAESINAGDTLLCHVNTVAAMAAGLVGPDATHADKGVTWLRKDKFERAYPLNDEEKLELGNHMAEAQKRIDELEDELADIRKEYKAKIDQQRIILSDAAKEFRNGKTEPVPVECDVFQNWDTEELVFVACDDGVELFRRPMTAEEKQPTLFTSAPGGSAPLGEEPRRRMDAPASGPMAWGHTCIDCGRLADKEAGQAEECATCSQAVEGGTDNWTPRRECKTCAHKHTAVNMPPCKGCIHNPDFTPNTGEDADDNWLMPADFGNSNATEEADAQGAAEAAL